MALDTGAPVQQVDYTKLRERLLRPASVIVAKKPTTPVVA